MAAQRPGSGVGVRWSGVGLGGLGVTSPAGEEGKGQEEASLAGYTMHSPGGRGNLIPRGKLGCFETNKTKQKTPLDFIT